MTVYLSSRAQNQSSDSTSFTKGAWALQFGIAGNFTLTSFQGTTIAAKYQLSDRNAIRAGITISGNTSDGSTSTSASVADTSDGTVPGGNSTNAATVSLVFQYLWYINPSGPVHFYVGLGPSFSYTHSNSSSDNFSLSRISTRGYWTRTTNASHSTQRAIGGAGIAGVEWFATRWLALHAGYNESFQYQWGSTSSNQDNSSSTYPNYIPYHIDNFGTNKGWVLSSSSVSFGLNVYL
jgi:hypothetical protein